MEPPTSDTVAGVLAPASSSFTPTATASPKPVPYYVAGTWSACSLPCGNGTQWRDIYCMYDGFAEADLMPCVAHGASPVATSQPCNTAPCPVVYWLVTSQWSRCSSQCIADPTDPASFGVATRDPPVCVQGTATAPVADSVCNAAGLTRPNITRTCNRVPCPSSWFYWRTSPWSECLSDKPDNCGLGAMRRSVSCVGLDGVLALPSRCNSTLAAMPPAQQPCDTGVACSCGVTGVGVNASACESLVGNHSVCSMTSQCVCAPGWSGPDCNTVSVVSGGTPQHGGLPNSTSLGRYCNGRAVDAVTGLCCAPGDPVAANGRCCVGGRIDGCGVCNGDGLILDRFGTCCNTPLAANGMCCTDPNGIDSYGVMSFVVVRQRKQ